MDGKPRLFSIEKFVKNENITNGRLASLKLPRDLSLGGNKPKKVYTPNLNVVRNKDKTKEYIKKETNYQRNGHERKNHHKQKDQAANRYIQSGGVFSEGLAEIKRPSHSSGKTSSYSDRDNVASIVMPKINRNSWNVNKKEEATIANDLMTCEEDDSSTDNEYEPVVLPLDKNSEKFSKNFKIFNEDFKIKEELIDGIPLKHSTVIKGDTEKNKNFDKEQNDPYWLPISSLNIKRKFNEDENILSLIRLPDSIPGKSFTEDSNKLIDYTASQLPEGQLGKIIIRQSGKMEAIIANTKYNVETEEPTVFAEDIVMFPGKNSTSAESNAVNFGSFNEKFAITPTWDGLFQGKKS